MTLSIIMDLIPLVVGIVALAVLGKATRTDMEK